MTKPCQTPDNCRKPKRGPCGCSISAEARAAMSLLQKGKKISPEAILKAGKTKRERGIIFIPAHLKRHAEKLRRCGIKGAELWRELEAML